MSTPLRRRRPRPVLRAPVVATALATVLVVGGCSDAAPSPRPASSASETPTTTTTTTRRPVTTRARMGTVVGRLPGTRRRAVSRHVTAVLDRWWDTAYVGGDYPGADVARFPGFTPGANRRARYDRDLTSNADIGGRVRSVTALMRKARLDLLAVDGRARSVTARFDLRMRVAVDAGSGTRSRRLQVRGRAFLTRRPSGWRIFGYDVSKGWLA